MRWRFFFPQISVLPFLSFCVEYAEMLYFLQEGSSMGRGFHYFGRALLVIALLGIAVVYAQDSVDDRKKLLERSHLLEKIKKSRDNPKKLRELLPIVHCSFEPSQYELILMTQLRNTESNTKQFRAVSEKIAELLVTKVVECLPTQSVEIQTPVAKCVGRRLDGQIELVSIMRSGDALLEGFIKHFPEANVTKILIQRDEETAEPNFQYMKISPTIASGHHVIITEPMIATGGSLETALTLLKEKGVQEENIVIAAICVAPEGLIRLHSQFPKIKVVMTALDERLNEKQFLVPGLGDFGDRYFGTPHGSS